MNSVIYIVSLPFVLLAAGMAYLITYNEWLHHYPTKKEPRKLAIKAAIVTFIFFSVSTLLFAFFIDDFIK